MAQFTAWGRVVQTLLQRVAQVLQCEGGITNRTPNFNSITHLSGGAGDGLADIDPAQCSHGNSEMWALGGVSTN